MSFFRRKAKGKEQEKLSDVRISKGPVSVQSPSLGTRNHAIQEAAGPSHVAINAISANMDSFARGRTAILKKQPCHMEAVHFGDLGRSCLNYQTQETKSQLSKTVDQILRDSMALPYFIQFTELRRAEHLVKFWLEAESFRSTSWSRIRAHSLNTVMHSSLAEPASPSRKQHENKEPSEDLALGQLQPSEAEEAFSPARTHRQASPLDTCSGRSSPNYSLNSDNKESYALHGDSKAGTPTKEGSSKAVVPSGLQSPRTIKDLSGKLMKSTFHSISRTFKGDSPPPT